jgi:hypothetical protein
LEYDGQLYRFSYTRGALNPGFKPFRGMDDLHQVYESEELFPLFANRLLSESRPEYEAYLRWSGLDVSNPPDPIVVLAITEGIRETDAIEVFPCPARDAAGRYLNKFFLHGIRWLPSAAAERVGTLTERERLLLMLDFQNEYDSQAVAVRTALELTMIGYVPRYLARDVWHLVQRSEFGSVEVSVVRVNKDAPLQNRLLCLMSAGWPEGFRPCVGDDFLPIPAELPARCSA